MNETHHFAFDSSLHPSRHDGSHRWLRVLRAIILVIGGGSAAFANDRPNYRVGIVTYDDITGCKKAMERCFSEIGTLRFAGGTAEEVLDRVTSGLVDIAVVSPGALAATGAPLRYRDRIKRIAEHKYPGWDARYLITPELLPTTNPFASEARRTVGGYVYEELILVDRESWHGASASTPSRRSGRPRQG